MITQVLASGTPTGDQLFGLFQSPLVPPFQTFDLLLIATILLAEQPLFNTAVAVNE